MHACIYAHQFSSMAILGHIAALARCGILTQIVVCQSVTTASPAKMAEPIEMLYGMWTQMGSRNKVLAGGPDPPMEWALLMTSGFSHMLPSTIPSGPNVGISPHAVDQRFDWLAAKAVRCHVKCCQT